MQFLTVFLVRYPNSPFLGFISQAPTVKTQRHVIRRDDTLFAYHEKSEPARCLSPGKISRCSWHPVGLLDYILLIHGFKSVKHSESSCLCTSRQYCIIELIQPFQGVGYVIVFRLRIWASSTQHLTETHCFGISNGVINTTRKLKNARHEARRWRKYMCQLKTAHGGWEGCLSRQLAALFSYPEMASSMVL